MSGNIPPRSLIEFRLVKNIDTLIRKILVSMHVVKNSSSTQQTVFNHCISFLAL